MVSVASSRAGYVRGKENELSRARRPRSRLFDRSRTLEQVGLSSRPGPSAGKSSPEKRRPDMTSPALASACPTSSVVPRSQATSVHPRRGHSMEPEGSSRPAPEQAISLDIRCPGNCRNGLTCAALLCESCAGSGSDETGEELSMTEMNAALVPATRRFLFALQSRRATPPPRWEHAGA